MKGFALRQVKACQCQLTFTFPAPYKVHLTAQPSDALLPKMIPALLCCVAISLIAYRLVYRGAPEGIPRYGKAGGIGYLIAALRYTIKSEEVLDEAEKVFGGRTYAIPTLAGWIIVLSAEHKEMLRVSDDSVVCFIEPFSTNVY